MKSYKYLYKQCTSREVIDAAYKKLRKGKTTRADVKAIDENYEAEAQRMQKLLLNSIPKGKPELINPPKHKAIKIYESGKYRTIYEPEIHEQWLHHIIIQVFEPIVMKMSYKFSCGSLPGRGVHSAMREIRKWLKDAKATRYCWKFDIRHFYDNVRHEVLWRKMRSVIHDEWFMQLCQRTLYWFKKGLPLGYYVSQWFANFLLIDLDNLIVSQNEHYVRFMDDGTVFGSNKKKLHRLRVLVRQYLGRDLRLRFKKNWQIFKIEYIGKTGKRLGRKLDFMGFAFDRYSVTLRKSVMLRISRCAKKFKTQERFWLKRVCAMISYFGWIKAANVYDFYLAHVKPYVAFKKLRKIISKESRRLNKNHDKLAGRVLCGAA